MATPAIYTFIDSPSRYYVYKHWDNDPSGAAQFISNALKESWELPRFEADEFAAAFITANKKESGDIRIAQTNEGYNANFRYEIRCKEEKIHVKAFAPGEDDCFFDGFLDEFKKYTRKTWNDWIKTL